MTSSPSSDSRTSPSLEDLAAITSGSAMWYSTALGDEIRQLTLTDGPHGIRRQPEGGDNLGIGGSAPATCFPPAVGLGSTWNTSLVREVGEALGIEARALDVDVLLGPGLNIKRSPLGGRNFEYLSEDPYVSGKMAGAMVDGIQSTGVAATPKHFAVNNQETDRMRYDAIVDEVTLRELYLRGFEYLVKEHKPWALMCAYNKINGVYASQDPWLLTSVLRDEWGFDGLVMSDWGAVNDRVAAVQAGLDLEMPPSGTDSVVVEAVRSGALKPETLQLVRERLATLADRTVRPADAPTGIPVEEHDALARRAAGEAIVLLKNEAVLPLSAQDLRRVAVIGPFAHTPRYQGGGSSRVVPTRLHNFLEEFAAAVEGTVAVVAADGFSDEADAATATRLAAEALSTTEGSDVAIVFLGQPANAESEGFDRSTIKLPQEQLDFLERLAATGIPIVSVINGGGVVELDEVAKHSSAVVSAWLLGQAGGAAISDVLLGTVNPSGRLAETIPHRLQDTPCYLTFPGRDSQVLYGEGRYVGYRYYDAVGVDVAYPFGFGLSYTTFGYADLAVSPHGEQGWNVQFTVTNTGERAGAEVAQLYVHTLPRADEVPFHELRGFQKVWLEAGESQRVSLALTLEDLARWDVANHRWSTAAGEHAIEIGASSRDIRLTGTVKTEGDGWIPPLTEWNTISEWAAHPLGSALLDEIRKDVPAGTTESAPELVAMFMQLPVIKIASWPFGPDEKQISLLVSEIEAQRAELLGAK